MRPVLKRIPVLCGIVPGKVCKRIKLSSSLLQPCFGLWLLLSLYYVKNILMSLTGRGEHHADGVGIAHPQWLAMAAWQEREF